MKIKFLILLLLSSGCAIQGEIYRLQQRMNPWMTLLSDEEDQLFASNNTNELGAIIDNKEKLDPFFAKKMRELRIAEAIMSFDGTQTAHFYYHVLLKDLAKFSYHDFMKNLSPDELDIFLAENRQFKDNPFSSNKKIIKIIEDAKKNYGMTGFNDIQILNYYRTISLPAIVFPVVYDLLAFLAKYGALSDFMAGDFNRTIQNLSSIEKNKKSRRVPTRKQAEKDSLEWKNIIERTQFFSISDEKLLEIIKNVILPEMDPDIRERTLSNISTRFGVDL
ncbi:hypothetical protein SAMN02745150_00443 [Brevinema andersonii]|uniref:Lipoprotein n=1 Tax=Brevinema andersonii TaxID=34097 RepID=A0A1I1DF49_BREAD|nr:hypothetical protein [Brevinema andersonii]SFB71688.1 hypothetical protein SAMN02745150_00443 [Brevinema andersonii]